MWHNLSTPNLRFPKPGGPKLASTSHAHCCVTSQIGRVAGFWPWHVKTSPLTPVNLSRRVGKGKSGHVEPCGEAADKGRQQVPSQRTRAQPSARFTALRCAENKCWCIVRPAQLLRVDTALNLVILSVNQLLKCCIVRPAQLLRVDITESSDLENTLENDQNCS